MVLSDGHPDRRGIQDPHKLGRRHFRQKPPAAGVDQDAGQAGDGFFHVNG